MSTDVYQIVTDRIVGLLERGTVPWRIPYRGGAAALPKNLKSGKPYRGVNVFLLAVEAWGRGYESAYWLTFKQAGERGGHVRRGEKSTPVVFWKQIEVEDRKTSEAKNVPILRYYRVFNVAQCEGIEAPDAEPYEPLDFTPIEAAQSIVEDYADPPAIEYGHAYPCYKPASDQVQMPAIERFISEAEMYSTLLHELAHSTGSQHRLNRGLERSATFGSKPYGKEELIAEMAAAFLCAEAGIGPATLENNAAYVQGWLKQLRNDRRLIVHAAGAAQKAADWILGRRPAAAPHHEPAPAPSAASHT